MMLNYLSKEMQGRVCPTDSRFRKDIRLYEEGHIEQSDAEKVLYETRQRRVRKLTDEGQTQKQGYNFFREVPHPYTTKGESREKMYELIEGERGYWARRENGDWDDMPNLWGPWQ